DVAAKRERTKEILSGGFVGRVDELKAIRKFLYEPQEKAPLKCIYISGMPGAGKSYLLEECVKRAWEVTPKPIVLRLDFDRRSLNPFQPINVILELASQLVEELPEHASRIEDLRRELVRDEALRPSYSTGFALAPSLGKAMCNAINASSRPVLIVLDTLEVLRGYGESHPGDLFDFLDRFCRMGMRPISILAGGRDSVASLLSNPKSRRIATHLPLDNLIEEEAVLLLERRDCPPERAADIFARVGGNPLLLQLTHEASKDDPGLLDQLPTDKAPEFIGAYLYRAILSRIDDPLLERIAQPCLILSEITSDLISNVIGSAIEGEVIEAERAEQLLDELKSHHWLVKEEPGTGAITHHLDVRGQLLPMIYKEIPIQARDVNAEAAEWYELNGEEMLAAYHRLQLSRDDGDPAMPDVEIAWQFRDDLIDELPQEAADELRQLRGERSSVARKASSSREPDVKATPRTNEPDKSAVKELMLALERGDLSEAALIHANAFPRRCKPGTQAAVAQLNFWWFAGFWSHARKCVSDGPVLEVDGLPEEGGDLSALVSLEMQAESDFSKLARAFGREGKSEFLRRAQHVYLHGKLLRLDQGPLAYAMLCDDRSSPISGGYFEALGTAGVGLDDKGHALGFGLQDAERVLRKCGLEPIDPHGDIGPWAFGDVSPERAVHAHMLSLLNPYLKPISALIHQSQSEILKGSLHNLAERSVQLPRVWSRDVTQDDWREQSSHDLGSLVEWIGALGLTSDWTGALTFFRPLHHLTWLAKAAERWRRTSAGNWSYGSVKPIDWHDQP
ncbi:MAG: ATP-binding protein, partial [Pseudomonadota bacterium]